MLTYSEEFDHENGSSIQFPSDISLTGTIDQPYFGAAEHEHKWYIG